MATFRFMEENSLAVILAIMRSTGVILDVNL